MVKPWFYNTGEEPSPNASIIEIECIYCIDYNSLNESQMTLFETILNSWPGNCDPSFGFWYGNQKEADSDFGIYLCGSVEPVSYQVFGRLERSVWENWHAAFVEAIEKSGLPVRPIDFE